MAAMSHREFHEFTSHRAPPSEKFLDPQLTGLNGAMVSKLLVCQRSAVKYKQIPSYREALNIKNLYLVLETTLLPSSRCDTNQF